MLHAKFQDHRTSGSGEEDFLSFLPYMYMGVAAILACDLGHLYKLSFPFPKEASHEILALIGHGFFEKKSFENIGHIHVYNPGAGADNPLG